MKLYRKVEFEGLFTPLSESYADLFKGISSPMYSLKRASDEQKRLRESLI